MVVLNIFSKLTTAGSVRIVFLLLHFQQVTINQVSWVVWIQGGPVTLDLILNSQCITTITSLTHQ